MARRGRRPRGKKSMAAAAVSRVPQKRRMEEEAEEEVEEEGPKMLMRPWLMAQVGKIKGLVWSDREPNLLHIPWMHGSSRSWHGDDVALFSAWAEHSGKSSYLKRGDVKPNRLKANFRCAINSQVDIKEERSLRISKGPDACKVYRFLEQQPRRSELKKRRTSSDMESCQDRRPLRSNSSLSSCSTLSLDLSQLDHEEEVISQELLFDHSYSTFRDDGDSRIPTTVSQMNDDDQTAKDSYADDSGDDSAFSEMSDISEELVPVWIKSENIESEILELFDERTLLGSSDHQLLIIEEELDETEGEHVLTELIPVPRTNMSIAIMP